MGKIDELIKELCPDRVEYVKLGEICEIYDGTHQTPKYVNEGIPFISVENIQNIYGSQKFISIDDYNSYKIKPQLGDMFMTRIGTIGTCAIVNKQEDIAYYVSLALLRPNHSIVNVGYLKHLIESNIGVNEIRKHSLLHAVPIKINKNDICKIQIPLPPLSIQQQIVEILDTFTDSISNLQEELELREKQMEYYRERLFNVNAHQYKVVKLSEVATYSKLKINASSINKDNYVSVENLLQNKGGKVESTCCPNEGNWTKFLPKDILIGNIRPYLKKIWFANCEGGTNGDVLDIRVCNDILSPEFLFKVLSSDNFFAYNTQNAAGAKMPRGNKEAVMKYSLPIPPKNKQQEIVDILDTFESMIANIKEEIALRQKQYEYYREKLLTFERKEA